MNFKIGDRVKYIGSLHKRLFENNDGRIVVTKEEGYCNYLVEFDNKFIIGHDGLRGADKPMFKKGHCYWLVAHEIKLIEKGGEKKMAERHDKEDMRSLFNVVVVNPTEEGEIVYEERVVARDMSEAKYNASFKEVLKEKGLKLRDVDIVVVEIGDKNIRPYETVQKVKIIGSVNGVKVVKTI